MHVTDGLQQELLPTPAQGPTLGKYLHGSKEESEYQLKGAQHKQRSRRHCKNKEKK